MRGGAVERERERKGEASGWGRVAPGSRGVHSRVNQRRCRVGGCHSERSEGERERGRERVVKREE